ncbi:MAG: alanine racemase [Rhodospirillaceae bacterium]|nr:alanine racemase [Rhodospirillaceae bacterium]
MVILEETGPPHAGSLLTIDLDAIGANYRLLAERAHPAECAAVVKADAYGLGVGPVARILARQGCATFFVAHLDEAIELRGILPRVDSAAIYVLNGLLSGEEATFHAHGLRPVLNDLGQIDRWSRYCSAESKPLPAAIQLDTGMSRLGLPLSEQAVLFAQPDLASRFQLSLVMSHLACADTPEHPLNRTQQREFSTAIQHFPGVPASIAASSGVFLGPDWRFDLVRPGVCLYGVKPNDSGPNPMAQVIRLQGKILQIHDVDTPRTVGYGASHRIGGPTRIATVAAGYADGLLRILSNRGVAHVGEIALPILGRVSMDLITLDLSPLGNATETGGAVTPLQPGDLVDLIGPYRDVDAVAADADTIGYEILTSLGSRYRRRYIGAPSAPSIAEAHA